MNLTNTMTKAVVVLIASAAVLGFAFSAKAACTPTTTYGYTAAGMTLRSGAKGPAVVALQTGLKAFGGATNITIDGSYGPMTASAVGNFQSMKMLTADKVAGPMTQNALAAASATTVSCDSTPNPSNGNGEDGDITNVNEVSSSDSSITEGETSEVFAFEFEVEGDVTVDRVDIYLDTTAAGTESENAEDYFSSAILMVDGEEVDSIDAEDFDEDSYAAVGSVTGDADEYRLRFTGLDLDFSNGDEPEFTVAFEVNNTIDSGDLTETFGIELESDSIRFVDGRGFSSEEGASLSETFGADSEETAELQISTSSDDLDASTIEVSDSDETEDVEVFIFEIEEENGVDVTINDLTVTVTTGGTADEAVVVTDAKLFNGSEELASESVPTGGVVNFEDIDLVIDADDTAELTVKLSFADVDDYNEGDTVTVAFTSIDDAEDANSNDEGDMTISGTPSGSTHTLRSSGIMVQGTDKSAHRTFVADDAGEFDQGTFVIVFEVTAFGENIWIDNSTPVEDTDGTYATTSTSYNITNSGSNGSVGTLSATGGDYDEGTNGWKINSGDTAEFTLEVTATASADSSAQVILENIGYALTDANGTTSYLVPDEAEFKTASITLLAA